VGTLSLENALIAISSLIMLSIMSGLLFAVLVQPRRDRTNFLFSLFCGSLLLWSLIALTGPLEGLRFGLGEGVRLHLLASAIGLSSLTFFLFIVRFAGSSGKLPGRLVAASPILLVVALLIIWSGSAYSAEFSPELTDFQLQPAGYLALGTQIIYALVAFGIIMSSPQEPVRQMRLPGLLMILVYGSLFAESQLPLPLAILLATVTAARMGWVVLRQQLFNPMQALTDELRVANLDLSQTLSDLAAARLKTEALTRQLEAASQYRSDFLDNLGHRLRTPLNSIAGYSQLLQSGIYGELNDKQADRLGMLHRNTNTLLELISHMLDLNAIQAGRLDLNHTAVALESLMRSVFEAVEQRCVDMNARLTCALPADLRAVYGDEQRLRQVFILLVDNALKFSTGHNPEPPEVTVKAANVSVANGMSDAFPLPVLGWLSDGEWVVVSVIDQGIGIAPEEQARIFDEFFQTANRQAAELAGSGLGLAIAKRLVERQDGVLWVKSVPEQGSTFFVALRASRNASTNAS
jgi:signal transduction histidine kinase